MNRPRFLFSLLNHLLLENDFGCELRLLYSHIVDVVAYVVMNNVCTRYAVDVFPGCKIALRSCTRRLKEIVSLRLGDLYSVQADCPRRTCDRGPIPEETDGRQVASLYLSSVPPSFLRRRDHYRRAPDVPQRSRLSCSPR